MHFLLLSLLASFTNSLVNGTKDCSTGTTIGHIQTISMNPSAPVAGQIVHFAVEYLLDSLVTDGEAKYTASLNGFPLSPTIQPLCPDVEKSTPCPISAGLVKYEGDVQMGDGTVHGTLDATTTWYNQEGIEIVCWGFTVRI